MTTPTPEPTALTDANNAVFSVVSEDETVSDESVEDGTVKAAVELSEEVKTLGMVALVPSVGNAERLAVENGLPVDELHCTVLFLGEVAGIPDETFGAMMESVVGIVREESGPLVAEGFNVSLFNPHREDRDTCVVLGLSGRYLAELAERIRARILEILAEHSVEIPEQHVPWIPHMTLAYTDDHNAVMQYADRTGDITFDRIRIALGDDVYDVDLFESDNASDGVVDLPEDLESDGMGFTTETAETAETVETDTVKTVEAANDDPVEFTTAEESTGAEASAEQTAGGSTDVDGDIPEDSVTPEKAPGAWHGILVVEGVESGDGRMFAADSLKTAPLPLPLMWQRQTEEGHKTSVQAGRIDEVWREGNQIWGQGVFDLDGKDGAEAYRQVKGKFLRGVSVDVDSVKNADIELVFPDGVDASDSISQMLESPDLTVFHRGRLRGATLVQFPAFVEASISLAETEGSEPMTAGASECVADPVTAPTEDDPMEPEVFDIQDTECDHSTPETMTACGCLDGAPPREHFENPRFTGPMGMTVTEDGRVYGHAALWGTCHTGFSGVCRTAPREGTHEYFLLGETLCADGSAVATGTITLGTGHAATDGSIQAYDVVRHYDHTGTAVADIATGEDEFGIWFSGSIRSNVSPVKLRTLRGSKLSGDWRKFGRSLRLVALLAVNVPGFPVPRVRASVSNGRQTSLVAAGINPMSAAEMYENQVQESLRSVVGSLARRIGRDPKTRMQELSSNIHGRK